ncbi:MAG TPA: SMI1/KNR4 family protein [Archangium sp.]|uniref:SMI1/KNR4 family protein n=1 Tax=Archangium sp. TaxID=1872627 RepID=UPI002E35FCCC|nr:SMI1/KNR4 family protein [Archangium sp.]HEX5753000.1 SMI1/KNR4 family protein [Archangium sp.]
MSLKKYSDASYLDPANDKDILELEQALDVVLPMELRAFLKQSDGAAFGEETHRFRVKRKDKFLQPRLEWIFAHDEMRSQTKIFWDSSIYDEKSRPTLPRGIIVIGSAVDEIDEARIFCDLRDKAPRPGGIYYRHLSFDPYAAGGDNTAGLELIAPTFETFLNSLQKRQ